jgi:hypothetical protein|tara:strand:- start:119 stop:325 length:207 start_codon:yes stop_codon:yes gene_type:complete
MDVHAVPVALTQVIDRNVVLPIKLYRSDKLLIDVAVDDANGSLHFEGGVAARVERANPQNTFAAFVFA